jgi:phosphoribosylformimino-5-aminoimidazole carboxamide ribotide isomerase
MILYPAIDLKDGQCVRLRQGRMEDATSFSANPAAQAKVFAEAGCEWLHIVDLNGAFEGRPVNAEAVREIVASRQSSVVSKIQLGGGIRDLVTIESWLSLGIARVILGTVAVKNPALVREACQNFPGQIAVGIDAKDGFVATEGWAEVSQITALDLAKRFEDAGVAAIIHTDIARDGEMQGPNLEATVALAEAVSIPVIVSGGVASLEDLRRIRSHAKLNGAIVGRAIYEGMDIQAARNILESS